MSYGAHDLSHTWTRSRRARHSLGVVVHEVVLPEAVLVAIRVPVMPSRWKIQREGVGHSRGGERKRHQQRNENTIPYGGRTENP